MGRVSGRLRAMDGKECGVDAFSSFPDQENVVLNFVLFVLVSSARVNCLDHVNHFSFSLFTSASRW